MSEKPSHLSVTLARSGTVPSWIRSNDSRLMRMKRRFWAPSIVVEPDR